MNSYPFEDFIQDWTAVTQSAHSEDHPDFFASMGHLVAHMGNTYAESPQRLLRSMALGQALMYCAQNLQRFDSGLVAVAGQSSSLVTEYLLRAIHETVVEGVMRQSRSDPEPSYVLQRAQIIADAAIRAQPLRPANGG